MYRMEDYATLAQIAKVSSIAEGKRTWTELAIYYDAGKARPFVAAVWGCTRCDGDGDSFIPRVRSVSVGTLERAMGWFEPSRLRDDLLDAIPTDATTIWLDSNSAAKARAQERLNELRGKGAFIVSDEVDGYHPYVEDVVGGVITRTPRIPHMAPGEKIELRVVGITTDSLREALTWLYPDLTSATALAAAVDRDFDMPERTVRRALAIEAGATGEQGAWVGMFLKAMRCFDRQLWAAGQATIASVEG